MQGWQMESDARWQPSGYRSMATNVGIRDASLDFTVVHSTTPAAAAAVFTRNRFCGHPVTVGRSHVADGQLQAVVVNSKNANVATGPQGLADCRDLCRWVGDALDLGAQDVFPCSTGVIGRRLPMERLRAGVDGLAGTLRPGGLDRFAQAILTTDTRTKHRCLRLGDAVLFGCCKGSGMIAPDMATMLAFFFTDARVDQAQLDQALRQAVDASFHMVSVDGDTSTSDTAVVLANGQAGPVAPDTFAAALSAMAVELAQEIARDGEGATKLLRADVTGAPDTQAGRAAAKAIIDSPLVKTAVWGRDPNWGRVAMAVGKCFGLALDPDRMRICFGPVAVYDGRDLEPTALEELRAYLQGDEVRITVDLRMGEARATAWGCDLSPDYVRINGEYTT